MQPALVGWASTVASQAIATWIGTSSSKCHCSCISEADPALVGLIQGQLHRCGPEHLHRQCPEVGWAVSGVCLIAVGCLVVGFIVGTVSRPALDHAASSGCRAIEQGGGCGLLAESASLPEVPRRRSLARKDPRSAGVFTTGVDSDHADPGRA